MNILQINASARADNSASTRLANKLVQRLVDTQSATIAPKVVVRTLAATPHPEQDEATLQALFTPADQRSAAQAARVAQDDALIAELQAADVVVLGVPMYNFGVPAQLKNWIDALARVGVTFSYTDKGPVGLISGKKVYVATTRGGLHRGQPSDTQVPYLRTVLAFLGMTDVDVVYAEGLNMGPDAERAGLAAADAQIEELLAA